MTRPTEAAREEAERRMLTAAKLMLAQCEGCAVNHYGHDHEVHGVPGWLVDCAADIAAFEAAIASPSPSEAGGVDAVVVKALSLAREALLTSKPTMSHYAEPCARHKEAFEAVEAALAQMGETR